MALYALDSEGLISADEAPDRGFYRCLECNSPVQVRQGMRRRHFYHVKTAPSCRLYSKSEDHLLLQLQIQNLFKNGEVALEKPFLPISRIADICWERHKIIFEIQCSLLSETEARARIHDYGTLGYSITWLLDDRLFNRRYLRPAEQFMRNSLCYYVRYRRQTFSLFYDQFELFAENKRIRKGPHLSVELTAPRKIPAILPDMPFPKQIIERQIHCPFYFRGDLIHKALLSPKILPLAVTMQNWSFIEKNAPINKKISFWKIWIDKILLEPFWALFGALLEAANK